MKMTEVVLNANALFVNRSLTSKSTKIEDIIKNIYAITSIDWKSYKVGIKDDVV